TVILGVRTNLEYLRALITDSDVQAGRLETTLIERKLPALEFRHPDAELLSVAACVLAHDRARDVSRSSLGAWSSAQGWRTGGVREPQHFCFATGSGERADVWVHADSVTIHGDEHVAHLVASSKNSVQVELDG